MFHAYVKLPVRGYSDLGKALKDEFMDEKEETLDFVYLLWVI